MNRNDVMNFAKNSYGSEPEYLWRRDPASAVLRHSDNKKWYAIIMNVNKKSLGIAKEGFVDVLNVKCDPEMIGAILMQKGILQGYHMNKTSWISVLLDGTVPEEIVKNLLDQSFELTAGKKTLSKRGHNTNWLIPCNPKYYDIEAAFQAQNIIEWKQSNNICVGDMIYLYIGAPISAIRYKCKAIEVDIPYQYEDKNLRISKVMKIELVKKYDEVPICFALMKEHGVYAVRGPRSMPESLIQEINHIYFEE